MNVELLEARTLLAVDVIENPIDMIKLGVLGAAVAAWGSVPFGAYWAASTATIQLCDALAETSTSDECPEAFSQGLASIVGVGAFSFVGTYTVLTPMIVLTKLVGGRISWSYAFENTQQIATRVCLATVATHVAISLLRS
ncbi:MAG: hypothetical protein B7X06_01075 [Verrucomicrobia bacterium 21-51-4]|nr:MAG: hypothetical protein B7X06_01075 [Verrucomicrobia bacterium 21-51-4]HQU08797.1 hypothetical protein [Opitutales bacterium]